MFLSILYIPVFFAATVSVGMVACRPLLRSTDANRLEFVLLSFGVGSVALFFVVWAVGSVSYSDVSMWIVLAVWCILGLAAFAKLRRPTGTIGSLLASAAPTSAIRAGFALLAFFIVLTLLWGLAPPADYDGLNYHLSYPKRDLEMGRITAIANNQAMEGFPALAEMLFRLALATVGDRGAQVTHGIYTVVAALGAYCLAFRLLTDTRAAVLAAVMFLAIRIVIWESGTTHNELALAAYFALSLLAFGLWRLNDSASVQLMILFGLMVGAMCNVKYQGLALAACFGPIMLYDWIGRRRRFTHLVVGIVVALAVFVPWMVRNMAFFGNPMAPMLAPLFPESDPAMHIAMGYMFSGPIDAFIGLIRAPWDIFVLSSYEFDGQVFGAPYLLVLMPLAAVMWPKLRAPWVPIIICGLYFVIWYITLFQQIRFLIPVFPIMTAFAAIGAVGIWASLPRGAMAKGLAVLVAAILIANQSMFVAAYAAIRLPVILGFVDQETYLTKTPSIDGTLYPACNFISRNLGPGERYLSVTGLRSYYCPQAMGIFEAFDEERLGWRKRDARFPELTAGSLARRMNEANVRWVLVPTSLASAVGPSASVVVQEAVWQERRFGRPLAPVIGGLEPVFVGPRASVYRATDIQAMLVKRPSSVQ